MLREIIENFALGYDLAWTWLGLPFMRLKEPDVLVEGRVMGARPWCPDGRDKDGECGYVERCAHCNCWPYDGVGI